jgi:hypothetical protein
MALRWTYTTKPDVLPTVRVSKVGFADIPKHLVHGTGTVTSEQRREQIALRQAHVQRRYRQY